MGLKVKELAKIVLLVSVGDFKPMQIIITRELYGSCWCLNSHPMLGNKTPNRHRFRYVLHKQGDKVGDIKS